MRINIKRLEKRLEEMSEIGRLPNGGVSRLALSKEDKISRNLLSKWMKEIGLDVKIDSIGNMFGVFGSLDNKIIGIGSHLDTVPTGGYFDGALGVLVALEVVQIIKEKNIEIPVSLAIINFTNEEGVRFTPDMMGSLAYANPEQLDVLLESIDSEGNTVKDSLNQIGFMGMMKPGEISFDYFLELHIEQGPILEAANCDIGVVESVQSIKWLKLRLQGKNDHAGTTPIHMRKDPFYALSRLSNFIREVCLRNESLLATIGSIKLYPNSINVIPEWVEATIDFRNPKNNIINKAIEEMNSFIDSDQSFENIDVKINVLADVPSVQFDTNIINKIIYSSNKLGYSYKLMYSGAGHDSQLLAPKYPSAMLFIPSKDGISHSIDEFSSIDQIEKGANVLLNTVMGLSNDVL